MKLHLPLLLLIVSTVMAVSACGGPKASGTVREDCRCEDGCASACQSTTSYKTVERDPDAPDPSLQPQGPFEPMTPDEGAELLAIEEAKTVIEGLGDEAVVFRGDFASDTGDELWIVLAERLEVRDAEGSNVARRDATVDPATVRTVQLIDGRAELTALRTDETGVRHVSVYRVIGESIAEVFTHPIGADESPPIVEFGRIDGQWAIRVTDTDETSRVYLWNQWEGMFRVPSRAPTAPRR